MDIDFPALWAEYIRPSLGPLATVVAASVAAVVAWRLGKVQTGAAKQQADTARNKLKLELFDRRLDVYEAISSYLDEHLHRSTGELTERHDDSEFLARIRSTQWLFERGVQSWVIAELVPAIAKYRETLRSWKELPPPIHPLDPEAAALETRRGVLLAQLHAEHGDLVLQRILLEHHFTEYLKLTH